MKNIFLDVSYDGTDFAGWQRQDKAADGHPVRTVQGEIEEALDRMLKTPVCVKASGRTDSGVHAAHQACTFVSSNDAIPPRNYERALNSLLPQDVRVLSSFEVHAGFDARKSATSRVYRYFVQTQVSPLATEMRYRWFVRYKPNIEMLNSMCALLKGEIDCASFAASGDKSVSTMRFLESASFLGDDRDSNLLIFEVEANAFLWKMVRTLVGTLLWCERKGMGVDGFAKILESKDRKQAGPTAPACGLFLWSVKFDGVRRHV